VKAAVLIAAALVLLVGSWALLGRGGDSLGTKLKQNLNEHPLLHSHHPGAVEAVECDEHVALESPAGDSFYDCLVRYDDGILEPWCASTLGDHPGGATGVSRKRCSAIETP
jgi:hypothetical protein